MSLRITGVVDGPLSGGVPKAVELYAIADIPDLSLYGVGSANNGNPSAGVETTLIGSAAAGDYIYVASEVAGFTEFFGFAPDVSGQAASINGDDAIELFFEGGVIDTFGAVGTDGTGEPWEYTDGWAYRVDGTGPDGTGFVLGNWTFSGTNALDNASDNATAGVPFPVGSYTVGPVVIAQEDFDGNAVGLIDGFDPADDNLDGGGGDFFGVGSLGNWPQDSGVPFGIADDSVASVSGGTVFPGDVEGVFGQNSDFDNDFFGISDTRAGGDFDGNPVTASWTFDISGFEDLQLAVDMGGISDGLSFGGFGDQTVTFTYSIDGGAESTAFALAATTDTGDFAFRPMDSGTQTSVGGVLEVTGDSAVTKLLAEDGSEADNTFLDKSPASGDGAGTLDTFLTDLTGAGQVLELTVTADFPFEAMVFDNIQVLSNPGAGVTPALVLEETDGTTEVSEGGDTDTVSLRLATAPQSEVTVMAMPDGQVTASPAALVFTPQNWDVAQAVTIGAVDDSVVEGDHGGSVAFTAQSADTDYLGLSQTVDVVVRDNDTPGAVTAISEIQGTGRTSPVVGSIVTVEAVLTAAFLDPATSDFGGFLVQEESSDEDGDPLTSEGLFVSAENISVSLPDLSVGDLVSVTGTVAETEGETQLVDLSAIGVIGQAGPGAITPASVSLPAAGLTENDSGDLIADLEAFEGMQVVFEQTLTVNDLFTLGRLNEVGLNEGGLIPTFTQTNAPDQAGYADFVADVAGRSIVLDDSFADAQNLDPAYPQGGGLNADLPTVLRTGDTVDGLTGVVRYFEPQFGGEANYRVVPTEEPVFEPINSRPDLPDVGGSLKVASFNVLNYFTTLDTGGTGSGPNGNQEPRGAETAEEFQRQKDKIVAALVELDADVVGLVEIENDPEGDTSLQDLVDALNAAGDRSYAFVDAGPIFGDQTNPGGGGDAIKVALIYDTETVETVGTPAILDESVDPRFQTVDTQRPALAQTFREIDSGETFTAATAHLKSKGSIVDNDADTGDGQGNNATVRDNATKALVDWLATDPTGSGDADVVILGDLNAYAQEDAVQSILDGADDTRGTADDFVNPIGADALTFGFPVSLETVPQASTVGTLDYALPSQSMASQVTGAAVWNINAQEPVVTDYNTNFKSADQQDFLYNPDPFRSSDHDPVVIGLDLTSEEVPEVFTLELLHVADQEASTGAVVDAPNLSAVMKALEAQDLGNDGVADNTLKLSSGDAIIPGVFFSASDVALGAAGIADIQIQNELEFEAITLGNHEFDFGTETLAQLISGLDSEGNPIGDFGLSNPDFAEFFVGTDLEGAVFEGAQFAYLSTNLDVSTDANLAPLEVEGGQAPMPRTVTSSVVTEVNGELIGVVGATTPTLGSISSPGSVGIAPQPFDSTPTSAQLDALAAEIQLEVDALLAANPGMDKVILASHFQSLDIEREIATRLTDVDIIIGGGSNTRLFDENDRPRDGDSVQGEYPEFITNAGGSQTALVNTDGSYKYVGRLVIEFDENGDIVPESYDPDVSGAYATDAQGVADLNAEGLIDPEVQAIADAVEAQILAVESNVFAVSDVFLNGNRSGTGAADDPDGVRTQETNLGNLTADANLVYAEELSDSDIQISLKNGGGIRASIGQSIVPPGGSEAVRSPNEEIRDSETGDIIKPEGGVSQNDIQTTLAFNNDLVILTLTAQEIVDLLEHGVSALPGVAGQFPQIAGVKFSFDPDAEEGSQIQNAAIVDDNGDILAELVRDGSVVNASATYDVVTLGFLAAPRFDEDGNFTGGGDGYPFPNTNTDPSVGEVGPDAARVNPRFLEQEGVQTGAATFADDGTEQDALAEYLNDNFNPFSGSGAAFADIDTGPERDERIQNLNFREDTIFADDSFVFDETVVVDGGFFRDSAANDLFLIEEGRFSFIRIDEGTDGLRFGATTLDDNRSRIVVNVDEDVDTLVIQLDEGAEVGRIVERARSTKVVLENEDGPNDRLVIRGDAELVFETLNDTVLV